MKSLLARISVLVSFSGLAAAQTLTFHVCPSGSQETPPVVTSGTSTATVVLDTATGDVTVSGTYQNLTSNQSVLHIHGPAAIGSPGGIVLGLSGSGGTSGTISGSGVLTPAQVTDMLNGLHYINIHSANHPGGELRGQIVQVEDVDCPAELPGDPVLADSAGNLLVGPKIGSTTDPFNLSIDCSNAVGGGIYLIELRLNKAAAPVVLNVGNLWVSGPKLFGCSGAHAQNLQSCVGGAGQVLPNDTSLVGLAYTAQGFCSNFATGGRTSNALVQVVGI